MNDNPDVTNLGLFLLDVLKDDRQSGGSNCTSSECEWELWWIGGGCRMLMSVHHSVLSGCRLSSLEMIVMVSSASSSATLGTSDSGTHHIVARPHHKTS